MMKMKNDFAKRNDKEDVSPFLSMFFILPCNTVYLLVCLYACCSYLHYSRPYWHRQITAWTSPTPFPLRIWALNAEAKKKKKNKRNVEGISSNSAILCVLYQCTLKYTPSFNDDDFTKTVFIIRKDKEYLFTGSTVCVCSDTEEGRILNEAGQRAKQCLLYLCACSAATEGIIA